MKKEKLVSVIIPVYNMENTIGKCLKSIYNSSYKDYEVIVVDDGSTDKTVMVANKFPCKVVRFKYNRGVSKARNIGAKESKGEILFFTDADCLISKNTLKLLLNTMKKEHVYIVGGVYSKLPYDKNNFFSVFHSIYVNYFLTKSKDPDYIASHCLMIKKSLFKAVGGFVENSFIGKIPSMEDAEFSHRILKKGYCLVINHNIEIRHIFNFSLIKSLKNGFIKSKFWTIYSIVNRDLFKSSGTASLELKSTVFSLFISIFLLFLFSITHNPLFLFSSMFSYLLNIIINFRFLKVIYQTKGLLFSLKAFFYYTTFYAIAVFIGFIIGVVKYLLEIKIMNKY